jgi:hypothetical protein
VEVKTCGCDGGVVFVMYFVYVFVEERGVEEPVEGEEQEVLKEIPESKVFHRFPEGWGLRHVHDEGKLSFAIHVK